jgi:FkbM family methyltransferase
MTKTHRIGRFDLQLPQDHLLDLIQGKFQLYDRMLGEIARRVALKYPDATIIDIGANVGDSAAALCAQQDIPVLCIEGHPLFVAFLRRNLPHLPDCVEVAECLVGAAARTIPLENMRTALGTATLMPDVAAGAGGAGELLVRPLTDVLRDHPRFQHPRLIKIDTDGSDFEILHASIDLIRELQPVLFFEYDPTFHRDGIRMGMQAITELQAAGYEHFLVYDNFGHFMDRIGADAIPRFADLSRYIMSHLCFGRQICYLDVCGFAGKDADLAVQLYQHHRDSIDAHVRHAGWQSA